MLQTQKQIHMTSSNLQSSAGLHLLVKYEGAAMGWLQQTNASLSWVCLVFISLLFILSLSLYHMPSTTQVMQNEAVLIANKQMLCEGGLGGASTVTRCSVIKKHHFSTVPLLSYEYKY